MTASVDMDLLEDQIIKLKKELEEIVEISPCDLTSPEILELNNKIDRLINSYIKLTIE